MQPYGYPVPTPNIQLLADQGVLFRNAFCAAPTCSGSRASLLTGQYCHNNGMLGLAHRGLELNDYGQHIVHPLRSAGYRSVLIGEQHISEDPDVIGYDEVIEVDTQPRRVTSRRSRSSALREPPRAVLHVGRLLRDPPPFEAPTLGARHALLAAAAEPPRHPGVRAPTWPRSRRAPARSTRASGRCSTACTCGLPDDTLIVCTTDHGLAFPNAKATLYDRGIGVMLIMRGPDGFTGGQVVDATGQPYRHLPDPLRARRRRRPDLAAGRRR